MNNIYLQLKASDVDVGSGAILLNKGKEIASQECRSLFSLEMSSV